MKLLDIRFCHVAAPEDAKALAGALDGLGLAQRDMGAAPDPFQGAVFPAQSPMSWVEVWPEAEGMPAGTMLQLVVDDADAFAENARANGLSPQGPMDAHGERIYFLKAPGGLMMSFQSVVDEAAD